MKGDAERLHYRAVIASPIPHVAALGLRYVADELRAVDFLSRAVSPFCDAEVIPVAQLLQRYLYSHSGIIAHRFLPPGTPFQQQVWQLLQDIPYGETRRYGELAAQIGSSARAVANACRANPLPLLIPCHRVVAANGTGGYMGQTGGEGLAIKQWLLQHEAHV